MARVPKPRSVLALGDRAVLAEFSDTLDLEANALIQRLAVALHARRAGWITDIVPALASLAVHVDPLRLPPGATPLAAVRALLDECLAKRLPEAGTGARELEVPVCYDTDFGPDLAEVAERCGCTPEEVVRRHAASPHRVLMVGFSPGQPYIGGLDPMLALPRRATPRTRVPAGSVAIANTQTTLYPFLLAGGWHLIGRTPLAVFDPARAEAALFAPGDRVRFVPVTRREFERRAPA